MDLFKRRSTAVVIFVVTVVLFSLIGCHLSLSRACRAAESAFFDRTRLVDYGSHTAPADQLEDCVKYANRLLSVINGSSALTEEYDALYKARQDLADALEGRDISDIAAANAALTAAVEAVDARVKAGAALPPSNDDYDAIVSDYFSAQRVAASSGYDDYIDDFIRTDIRPFPTNILRPLCFVSMPEKFT